MTSPNPRLVATLALLCAVGWSAWLWLSPAHARGFSDGQRTIAVDTGLRYASWGEPSASPWAETTRGGDGRAALSPDGRWLVWAAADATKAPGSSHDLFVAEIRDGRAGDPTALSVLCSDDDECAPAFGGSWLYFSSDRAGGAGLHDLWRARFADGVAQAPELVPGPANTSGDELDPAPLPLGDAIVFVADRDGAKFDLYCAPLHAGTTERLDTLCSPAEEREPTFTQAERALVFASSRAGGRGGFDLYRAARFDTRYVSLEPLAPLNSADDERAPLAQPDDLALGFVRSAAEGTPKLLRSPAIELFLAPGRPIHWMEWLALAGLLALALMALLVRRFPELDLIYKCLLTSVIVHLLLMWWFHDVWFGGTLSDVPRERVREPIHVRLAEPAPRVVAERAPTSPAVDNAASALEPLTGGVEPTLERAELASSGETPESPRTAPVATRAEDSAPPRADAAAVPVERPRPSAREPLVTASAAPSAAAPAAALSLPTSPGTSAESAASEAPERFESRSSSSRPTPGTESVAKRGSPSNSLPARQSTDVEPALRGESLSAIRDSAPSAQSAAPAPSLELGSLAEGGAASSTSRSLGTPVRPIPGRSPGSPAARPSSGSVAQAAPMAAASQRPSSSAGGARPSVGSSAGSALEQGEGSSADGNSVARTASPASGLALGNLAASSFQGKGSTGSEAGPERAAGSSDRRASTPEVGPRGDSVARRAAEAQTGSAAPNPQTQLAPAAGSRPTALGENGLGEGGGTNVAARASAAPALGLDSLAGEGARSSDRTGSAPQGPARAPSTGTAPGAAVPSAQTGGSLASRGTAPAPGVPRASGAGREAAPSRSERSVGLADTPESVAQPAAPAAGDSGRGWLSELAPSAQGSGAQNREEAQGPERAAAGQSTAAAAPQPLADSGPPLARAPRPPAEDEPGPAKSNWDSTPYQNRSGAEKARALKLYGGSERTEAAVAQGLAYLARIQGSDGAWGDVNVQDEKYGHVAVGKTALCTLAFLGAGHTPQSGTEYSAVVARALDFLLGVQDEASGHFGDASAYDHGISTYAVAECFALTHDQRLRASLERALAHVLAMQSRRDDDRFRGGWGYYFADGSLYDPWPRTSITAWQVMALESARLSGLSVPDRAFDEAHRFLANAHDPQLGAYRYNHEPERLNSAYPTLPASTPAALFALALVGEDITSDEYASSREYILERAPDGYRYTGEVDFVRLARGNPYFWYYGTLAMFRVGGAQWQRWNKALQESLLPAQARDGSWQPIDAYSRYARDSGSDKSYTTAMCVLSLEIYYRYYLPLLKVR